MNNQNYFIWYKFLIFETAIILNIILNKLNLKIIIFIEFILILKNIKIIMSLNFGITIMKY
jgi:hypothetical protein